MRNFLHLTRSTFLAFLMINLACVAVPYDEVLAGGGAAGPRATSILQERQLAQDRISAVSNSASAASNAITSLSTSNLFMKENLLDGIAWAVAKQMVSNMTRSLINWVNSGFEGSPTFVTDLNQLLLDSLDEVAGEYIKSLGGMGEFICSPFKLDVQAALTINYAQARSGMPSGPSEELCKLTDIGSNIENFLSGTVDSWDQWLEVTSNPQNTPYGAYLEAEAKLNARLRNEAGQEIEVASWGDGFLSKKVCQAIEGTTREDCKITTPGQVISQALTFQLSTGQRSLIEADEINELIGALLNQLVLKAVEGMNGLLGLSESGYDGGEGSYLDSMVEEGTSLIDYTPYRKEMDEALAREVKMLQLIQKSLELASSSVRNATSTPEIRQVMMEASSTVTQVASNLASLNVLINRYNAASSTASSTTGSTTSTSTASSSSSRINRIRQEVILDYLTLKGSGVLTTDVFMERKRVEWQTLIYPEGGGTL